MQTNVVLAKTGIKREQGYLYFVDKKGDISSVPMRNIGINEGIKKVAAVGIQKKPNHLYFVNKEGDICEVKMSRDGAKKKQKTDLAKPSTKFIVYIQKNSSGNLYRAKKILLAEKGRNFCIASPSKQGSDYGVVLSYEAKSNTRYRKTDKFIKLAGPALNVRVVNKIPQKYK
jgi:hypothetical protein